MKEHVDAIITHLTKLRPFLDDLGDVQENIRRASLELTNTQASLEKLKTTIANERNARAAENNRAKKEHDDLVHGRQGALADMNANVEEARTELIQVQNDIAKYQKRLDELAKQYNKEVKALA
jgi:uncharacterized protein (DUF3084 family)